MSAPKVVIVTPAPPGSRAGNRNTASRWAHILRELGCRVLIRTQWQGEDCDLLVALHARKSHFSLRAYRKVHPDRPTVLALTGTDVYRDIRKDEDAAASLEMATRMVVLQEDAIEELTPSQRRKTHVIHQSVVTSLTRRPSRHTFRVCVLGHLREEKDPFRTALALRLLPDVPMEVVHAGMSLSAKMKREADRHMRKEPRYRWVGERPHWEAMRLLSHSHAMVISSKMEGGAHVVSEAIAIGIPVIASDIPGNRGLLGADYPGYFSAGEEADLARLLRRASDDHRYLDRLGAAVKRRRPLVDPLRERRSWQKLLRGLGFRTI